VIAVNGWDEPRDVVATFIEENGYKQQVLLMGGAIAAEKYGVTSYPTTFLIDRSGTVVDFEMGFHPEMAEKLEKQIAELLEKQK
jgi:cytochrome c-type biogenesis protein